MGFCPGPSAGFWLLALGPEGSDFYYGPAPVSASSAVLTARGRAPIIVPTRPMPHKAGLPDDRFFVIDPPGPASVGLECDAQKRSRPNGPFYRLLG